MDNKIWDNKTKARIIMEIIYILIVVAVVTALNKEHVVLEVMEPVVAIRKALPTDVLHINVLTRFITTIDILHVI